MKYTALAGAFFAAVLITSPLFAFAKAGDPISGTSVGLEHDPGGVVISQTKTNRAGVAIFQNVKPGKYRAQIDWGDGVASGPISKKPTAVIEIDIPGQAAFKVSENESPLPINRIPFNVTGTKAQTVTIIITTSSPHGL
jgi:hypothetical protein